MNKKEAKKTLLRWVGAGIDATAQTKGSFLLLFFKKAAFSFR
ncbi:hypothetical protein [Acidiphilium sp. MT5]